MSWFSKIVFHNILGWKIEGTIAPEVKKCVAIVAPHTSWHDFYIGVFIRSILKIQVDFIAKKELFKPPFGWYFKWMGGTALDRTPGQKKVDAIAEIFRKKETFRLAMSPEGTRKKVEKWKTGFYYIAKKANVPIVMVSFDFGTKTVKFSEPFYPTDDIERDFKYIQEFYKGVQGKEPEKF
jgi:1-acyl-sn-glycerol-3-phosphate acyltransferase